MTTVSSFCNYTATTEIYTLSLHDALPIFYLAVDHERFSPGTEPREDFLLYPANPWPHKNHARLLEAFRLVRERRPELDRKSTRLNSSHVESSYAVFCLKKKKKQISSSVDI